MIFAAEGWSQFSPFFPKRAARVRLTRITLSAGGFGAFTQLLQHLPPDTVAFVLVQHLDPDHETAFTRLLSKATSMLVTEVIEFS
jgi:chemotaxis response regulator CheB